MTEQENVITEKKIQRAVYLHNKRESVQST